MPDRSIAGFPQSCHQPQPVISLAVTAKERYTTVANSQNLEEMKLPELKELAKQMGLRGTSTMRKPELLATLQAARNGGEAPEGVTVRAPKNTEPRRTRTAEQTPAAEPAAPQAAAAPEHPAAPAAPAAEPAEQAERSPRRAAHERQSADEFASTLLDELDLGAKPESPRAPSPG